VQVDTFPYVGSLITEDGDWTTSRSGQDNDRDKWRKYVRGVANHPITRKLPVGQGRLKNRSQLAGPDVMESLEEPLLVLLGTHQLWKLRAGASGSRVHLVSVDKSVVRQHRLRPDTTDVVFARRHQHVRHRSPACTSAAGDIQHVQKSGRSSDV